MNKEYESRAPLYYGVDSISVWPSADHTANPLDWRGDGG